MPNQYPYCYPQDYPQNCAECGAILSSAERVCVLRSALRDATQAFLAADWTHRVGCLGRRAASSIRPNLSFRYTQVSDEFFDLTGQASRADSMAELTALFAMTLIR
jgi:hypothetical protein